MIYHIVYHNITGVFWNWILYILCCMVAIPSLTGWDKIYFSVNCIVFISLFQYEVVAISVTLQYCKFIIVFEKYFVVYLCEMEF